MKAFFAVLALAAVAQAGVVVSPAATTLISSPVAVARSVVAAPATISRVPSLDSAVIQSDRIGGNFAYSVSEAHAHAITQPIIQHVAQPVAVSHQVVAAPQVVAHSVVAPQQVVVGRSILAHSGLSVAGLPAGTVLLK